MRCEQAGAMMSARLDGHLDRMEMSRLQEHLASCRACQAEWQKMQALDQLFNGAPMIEAPTYLQARVTSRIERREQARRVAVGGLALAVGVTTLAPLVLVPAVLGLVGGLRVAPALLVSGLETILQLLVLVDALSCTLLTLLNQFAVPFVVLGAGSLLVALVLNGLWITAVRRLCVAR